MIDIILCLGPISTPMAFRSSSVIMKNDCRSISSSLNSWVKSCRSWVRSNSVMSSILACWRPRSLLRSFESVSSEISPDDVEEKAGGWASRMVATKSFSLVRVLKGKYPSEMSKGNTVPSFRRPRRGLVTPRSFAWPVFEEEKKKRCKEGG